MDDRFWDPPSLLFKGNPENVPGRKAGEARSWPPSAYVYVLFPICLHVMQRDNLRVFSSALPTVMASTHPLTEMSTRDLRWG